MFSERAYCVRYQYWWLKYEVLDASQVGVSERKGCMRVMCEVGERGVKGISRCVWHIWVCEKGVCVDGICGCL